jgi:hypothetical protein
MRVSFSLDAVCLSVVSVTRHTNVYHVNAAWWRAGHHPLGQPVPGAPAFGAERMQRRIRLTRNTFHYLLTEGGQPRDRSMFPPEAWAQQHPPLKAFKPSQEYLSAGFYL